ncbi:hypothetical protein JTE90_022313 [Oedothorax gibbosus]|uniref:Centrosomal protein of 192 kDa n=1 Tax=Oedothorax gibbosus TaxID=931172 RepID=A0AAV6VYQ7_9ARAC|nr:hypothetical protein JTE90_022313 [Oedothorax gibbosus]
MEHHGQGFLNDTSLSKTPNAPLKTSTVLRPNHRRGSVPINYGAEASYTFEACSFPPLNEVTNIPSFAALKMKLNDSCITDDRNSSLGILQMENFSDFTDTSMNIAAQSKPKHKSKRRSKSKLCNSNSDKLVKKKSFPPDTTVLSAEDLDDYHNAERSSSSDIEYDGTNIPELNLDYDPISHKVLESSVSNTVLSKYSRHETESVNCSPVRDNTNTSGFNSQSIQSSNRSETSVATQRNVSTGSSRTKPRDSIFECVDPAYDSIFATLRPGDSVSEVNSTKMSELMKGPSFLDLNSSEIDSIFKNQCSAELNFLKNMEKLSLSNMNSSSTFCKEEISARSSSLGSAKEFTDKSNTCTSHFTSQNLSTHDFEDKVLGSSRTGSSMEKSVSYNFTKSFGDKNTAIDSFVNASEDTTFSQLKNDQVSVVDVSTESSAQGFDCPNDLNFKDMSAFVMQDNGDQFEVSDSDFKSAGEALELFKKDEEILKEEKKFEIGNISRSSALSLSRHSAFGDITAPSWFMENNGVESNPERISIGTLISARTECLGRLSQDSKRERPFFGTDVKTPIREEFPEGSFNTSESVDDTLHSSRNESSTFESQQETINCFYETPKSHFEITRAQGNNASALRDVFQNFEPNNESELIRASVLSELLNEESTEDPLKLASRILGKCRPPGKSNTRSKKPAEASLDTTLESDNWNTTLTRSSSGSNLGIIAKTPQNSIGKALSISNVELNNANSENNGIGLECPTCQQPKAAVQGKSSAFLYPRPPSSCSTWCSNPMSIQNGLQNQHGCMKYPSTAQEHYHHNLLSSWGTIPRSDNGSAHSCPTFNPYIQDMMRPQMSLQTPMPHFPVQGPVFSNSTLQGPSELVFPEKLSIGDTQCISLTVQNLPNLHFYHVSFLSATLNNEPVSLETARISFPGMVPCSTSNTTDIQVTLSPKYEGKVLVTLQIIASFNTANIALASYSNLSLQTKIKYESVRPCISISSKGQNKLYIDKVIAGNTAVEYITITNRCDAAVPLYLTLSDDSQDNHITFGLNLLKQQKHPAVANWKLLSPKILQYRLPCSKMASVVSDVNIPIIFEAGNQYADVNFTLTAAVESHSVRETLGWFRICASVGNGRLVLVDPKLSLLSLNARVGATCSKNLTVKNEASFPIMYNLSVMADNESFKVSPPSLNMKSMQSASITVSFSPTSADDVKGILQAAAQPHGRTFQVSELYGQVKSSNQGTSRNSSIHNDIQERKSRDVEQRPKEKSSSSHGSSILECNKKYLCWGGVDLGNSVYKTLGIKNSSNKNIKVKLCVKDKSNNFKIQGENNQHVENLTIGLNSKEQRTISVVFTPSKIELSSGFLVVKPLLEKDPKMFSLPLTGYGGTGKLIVSQVTEREGIGSCLDLVLPAEKRTVFNSILIRNSGVRALFVKALFSPAASYETEVQVSIDPPEFVLCEKEHKTLYVSYSGEKRYGLSSGDCGIITLLYGDEVLRQQMRRSTNETSRLTQNDMIGNIDFDGHFIGEEKVHYDPVYQCIPRIFSVFSMNVKRYLIHLNVVEPNSSYSQATFDAMPTMQDMFPELTFSSTMYSRRVTTAGLIPDSPPVQDFTLNMLNRLSMPLQQNSFFDNKPPQHPPPKSFDPPMKVVDPPMKTVDPPTTENDTLETWMAKPEVLVMDSSNKDNRISLINLAQQDLKFKIELAIDVISVSPVSGIIPAKGEIGLRITVIPFNYSKLSEDYKGFIKIICDGKEKGVLVNVIKDQRKTINVPEISVAEIDQETSSEESHLSGTENTIIAPPSVLIKDICDFPKEIALTTTVPGKVSENFFTVRNSTKVSAHWEIRPISGLRTKSPDDTSMSNLILQIRPLSGSVKSMETSNIVIKFSPTRQDIFSQYFELSIALENGINQKSKFKVFAKGSTCLTESTEKSKQLTNTENQSKKHKDEVYIDNENCEFPDTALGQSSVVYATVKNGSSRDVTLDILKPHSPFVVTQTSIVVRSKKFVKIPISFSPTELPKVYQDVAFLVLRPGVIAHPIEFSSSDPTAKRDFLQIDQYYIGGKA